MTYMGDLSSILKTQGTTNKVADQSTNKKAGQGLDMTDFLMLMVAQFQNQDMDNTASTSEMMGQMVQMSVVQAISSISSIVSESSVMTYAASLVGKEFTVGVYENNDLKEVSGTVTGTGTLNGQQIIFIGDDSYYLSQIMAVGKLPDKKEDIDPDGNGDAAGKDPETPETPEVQA